MSEQREAATTEGIDPAAMHLLASARMVLDRVAQGHDERLAAEAVANRIVDVIGHDTTDEPPHLLVAAADLLAYTDAHRMSVTDCVVCTGTSCYEEWAVLRDDLRNLIEAWGFR